MKSDIGEKRRSKEEQGGNQAKKGKLSKDAISHKYKHYLKEAIDLAESGMRAEALKKIRCLIKRSEEFNCSMEDMAKVYLVRGLIYKKDGDLSNAIKNFELAENHGSQDPILKKHNEESLNNNNDTSALEALKTIRNSLSGFMPKVSEVPSSSSSSSSSVPLASSLLPILSTQSISHKPAYERHLKEAIDLAVEGNHKKALRKTRNIIGQFVQPNFSKEDMATAYLIKGLIQEKAGNYLYANKDFELAEKHCSIDLILNKYNATTASVLDALKIIRNCLDGLTPTASEVSLSSSSSSSISLNLSEGISHKPAYERHLKKAIDFAESGKHPEALAKISRIIYGFAQFNCSIEDMAKTYLIKGLICKNFGIYTHANANFDLAVSHGSQDPILKIHSEESLENKNNTSALDALKIIRNSLAGITPTITRSETFRTSSSISSSDLNSLEYDELEANKLFLNAMLNVIKETVPFAQIYADLQKAYKLGLDEPFKALCKKYMQRYEDAEEFDLDDSDKSLLNDIVKEEISKLTPSSSHPSSSIQTSVMVPPLNLPMFARHNSSSSLSSSNSNSSDGYVLDSAQLESRESHAGHALLALQKSKSASRSFMIL